jgi:hypothetical protein
MSRIDPPEGCLEAPPAVPPPSDSALDQVAGTVAERSSQGAGARGIFGVGLHSAKKCGDSLTRRLFGGGLVNSQLSGELIHRNVGQDVIYSTHY